jgi:phosphoserine phosphatase
MCMPSGLTSPRRMWPRPSRRRPGWPAFRRFGRISGGVAITTLSSRFLRRSSWRGWRSGGAHATHGSRFPALPFTEPVDPAGILSAAAKVLIADRLCAEFGVERADCIAYGDSMSDKDLFAVVPVSVAINADHHLTDLATHSYVGRDLSDAYQLVQRAR